MACSSANYWTGDDFVDNLIASYLKDTTVHSTFLVSWGDVFEKVWDYIIKHKDKDELIDRLKEEIREGAGLCFTGRLTRLVNTLTHYHPGVCIKIGTADQCNAKIKASYNATLKQVSNPDTLEFKQKFYQNVKENLGEVLEDKDLETWLENIREVYEICLNDKGEVVLGFGKN